MRNPVTCTLLNLCLAGVFAVLPLTAVAVVEGDESCERVERLLQAGISAKGVVAEVVDGGMTLTEATVFAMACAGQDNRIAIATAGVALAGSLSEAQAVVTGVVAAAGETSQEAAAVREAFNTYKRTAKQPAVYEREHIPHGGFVVSPAT